MSKGNYIYIAQTSASAMNRGVGVIVDCTELQNVLYRTSKCTLLFNIKFTVLT